MCTYTPITRLFAIYTNTFEYYDAFTNLIYYIYFIQHLYTRFRSVALYSGGGHREGDFKTASLLVHVTVKLL